MIIAVPREILHSENRVALVPDTVQKLIKMGYEVQVEKDAGVNAYFFDEDYINAGAVIIENPVELYKNAEIILKVHRPLFNTELNLNEVDLMKPGSLLISFMHSLNYPESAKSCAEKGINAFSMDAIPRITKAQKMDALSSQTNLAGYKAVLLAANELKKIFPLMMTAAGTITPAKVVIMGAGIAGLQALGTARRLGAIVEVSDIRPTVKEEVLSLGGRFIEVETDETMQDSGGYAKEASKEFLEKQKALIFKHITEADIVITTALVPGRKSPVLITEEMVKDMKRGSVIVDMAVEFGGNCEISENGKTVKKYGVTIIGEPNLPSLIAVQTSDLYSKNLLALLQHLTKDGIPVLDLQDVITKGALITYKGEVIHTRTKELLIVSTGV